MIHICCMNLVSVIIPAFNEENGIGEVIKEIPLELVSEVVVINNASTDNTEKIARDAGATEIGRASGRERV